MPAIFTPNPAKPDVAGLVSAIARSTDPGSLGHYLESFRWSLLADYVRPLSFVRGQLLISQGELDRKLYFVESGDLKVDMRVDAGLVQLGIVGPGGVVGEGNFFSHHTRNASVSAYSDAVVWELVPKGFDALSHAQPTVALALAMALGGVLASRMLDVSQRITVT